VEDELKVKEELLREFKDNRPLAHKILFAHRREDETPSFHEEIIFLFDGSHKRVALKAFRGAAKSTLVEEIAILKALFREKWYILIIGNTWSTAVKSLEAIRRELTTNNELIELFGEMKAEPWSADNIVLANGVKIEAMGAMQAMRGTKHNSVRPDLVIIDDLEDEEAVSSKEARAKYSNWLAKVIVPALHPKRGDIFFIGTPLHPESLIEKKCNDPEWLSKTFPLSYIDMNTGAELATWPARFPIDWVVSTRNRYMREGNIISFQQEFQCQSEDVASKPFQASMIKVSPMSQLYMPVHIIVDPARTVKSTSARTGYVAASWVANRLIVHDAIGAFHRPDEIIKQILDWNTKYAPVSIGVETNALEEFIMQPLRAKMLETRTSLPLVDLRAPKDKQDFIKGLQPFYMSGSVVHSRNLPDLESELLQFPTGRIDVVNALAYMLKIRAGRPVYEDFTPEHVAPVLEINPALPRYLVVSSRPAMTAAAIVQYTNGEIRIVHSWVHNVPPKEAFPVILREAVMLVGDVKISAPGEQFDKFNNTGLPASAMAEHVALQRTALAAECEGSLSKWITKQVRGIPALLVSKDAKWVVNALGGGYARKLDKHGVLAARPEDNQYKLIMEAIESFIAWIDKAGRQDEDDESRNYAYTSGGVRYLTTLPNRR
jgi:hypothetical protein